MPSFFKKTRVGEDGQDKKNDILSDEKKGAKISIDLYETNEDLVIQSTIAGVTAKDLEISVQNNILIIRGERKNPTENLSNKKYFYQECYWGSFSKKLILPENTNPSHIQATVKDGILTIKIPKIKKEVEGKIEIRQEE